MRIICKVRHAQQNYYCPTAYKHYVPLIVLSHLELMFFVCWWFGLVFFSLFYVTVSKINVNWQSVIILADLVTFTRAGLF